MLCIFQESSVGVGIGDQPGFIGGVTGAQPVGQALADQASQVTAGAGAEQFHVQDLAGRRRRADFAGDHERAADAAKPVGIEPADDTPRGWAEEADGADGRRWRRQDHQERVRECAGPRRHQP